VSAGALHAQRENAVRATARRNLGASGKAGTTTVSKRTADAQRVLKAAKSNQRRLYSLVMRHEASRATVRRRGPGAGLDLHRSSAAVIGAFILVSGLACGARRVAQAAAPPPATDFLLAAGDSTFWVTTGPQGVRVRGSPLLLARYGGRFYELYVADEDHSFYDAVFTTQRIYRRDLLTGDSEPVFRDSTVAMAARSYARAHPHDAPLAPDAEAAEDPTTSVTGEVDIIDVDGPFVSYEYHGASTTKRFQGTSPDTGEISATERETVRRGVVDLRVAKPATLRGMFGPVIGDTAVARGRRAFAAAVDSVRAAKAAGDARAGRAAAALGGFVFDPLSFSLLDVDRDPAVQFFARGTGSGEGLTLPVPPIRLAQGADSPWWEAERTTLPLGGADSASDHWTPRSDVEIVARYDTAGGPEQGQGVVLVLRRIAAAGGGHDSVRREWRVGRFPAPTRRIYWLDAPPVDSVTRRALVRAFDESALYGEDARSVALPIPDRHGRSHGVAFASLTTRTAHSRSTSSTHRSSVGERTSQRTVAHGRRGPAASRH
jgi:hypothetical protein